MKTRPAAGPRFVRVEAAAEPGPWPVVSPSEPSPEAVREAACEALAPTPFPCADPGKPGEAPAYLLRLAYHVREGYALRSSPGQRARQSVLSGGMVFGEHDPPQDAAHELVWRFALTRLGEETPLFQSGAFHRHIQFWRFDVGYWLRRYFSE